MEQYTIAKSSRKDIFEILQCYDSANELFQEKQRANGNNEIIKEILDKTESYNLYLKNEIIGWIAWKNKELTSILEALYVKKDVQQNGYGLIMMNFYLKKIMEKKIEFSCLSVLKNAYWAIKFYEKINYTMLKDINVEKSNSVVTEYLAEHRNPWEQVLYKKIKNTI